MHVKRKSRLCGGKFSTSKIPSPEFETCILECFVCICGGAWNTRWLRSEWIGARPKARLPKKAY